MTKAIAWATYTAHLYSCPELDFFLEYAHSGISNSQLSQLQDRLYNSILAMSQLEAGAIANPDENRRVGHYWLRNPSLAPEQILRDQIEATIQSVQSFAAEIHSGAVTAPSGDKFTDILLIGIGGSALGPQFIASALQNSQAMTIHFLDNTDPDGMDITLSAVKPRLTTTLVIVISKSGGTAETRNGMLETQQYFRDQGLDFSRQAIAVTGEGSALYKTAQTSSWLAIFPMWDWVGGRTSVMSAVGLLPAALQKIDIKALLEGARIMDNYTRTDDLFQNPAALLAALWYLIGDGQGRKDMVILPYKDRLSLFSRYLQQLIMESLGKGLDLDGNAVKQGIAVYGNKGSTDQHAYVQQLRDGLDNFFVTFIDVLHDRQGPSILVDEKNTSGDYLFGFHRGTRAALFENDRPSITLTIPDLSPRSIGALIALYERSVGIYATLIRVNAYHQPGVEAGKRAASAVLKLKNDLLEILAQTAYPVSLDKLADHFEKNEKIMIYEILRHLAANHQLMATGSWHDPATLKISLPKTEAIR